MAIENQNFENFEQPKQTQNTETQKEVEELESNDLFAGFENTDLGSEATKTSSLDTKNVVLDKRDSKEIQKESLANRGLELADAIESGEATEEEVQDFLDVSRELDFQPKEVATMRIDGEKADSFTNRKVVTEAQREQFETQITTAEIKSEDHLGYLWNQQFPTEKLEETGLKYQIFVDLADAVREFFPSDSTAVENLIATLHIRNPDSIRDSLAQAGLLNDRKDELIFRDDLLAWILDHSDEIQTGELANSDADDGLQTDQAA